MEFGSNRTQVKRIAGSLIIEVTVNKTSLIPANLRLIYLLYLFLLFKAAYF